VKKLLYLANLRTVSSIFISCKQVDCLGIVDAQAILPVSLFNDNNRLCSLAKVNCLVL